jgi:hypothetical protein
MGKGCGFLYISFRVPEAFGVIDVIASRIPRFSFTLALPFLIDIIPRSRQFIPHAKPLGCDLFRMKQN